MKKLLLFLSIAILAFSGCSKDEGVDLGKFDYDTEIIFGTWQITHTISQSGTEWEWSEASTTATFNRDGSYSGKGYFGNGTGTYKLSGKTITCYVEGSEYMKYTVVSFGDANTTCILDMSAGGESLRIKCKKM